ncbi:MAG: hypothetical protein L0Y54_06245 [Sporichthyaceae bacterium]|nr:hypothetical protein [Sporichthyaceae bacterium]
MSLAIAISILVGAQAGYADTSIERAAQALASDHLYVDPAAKSALTKAERAELRTVLTDATVPIYLAVLPRSAAGANGNLDELPLRIYQASGERPGTYAVLVGGYFAAGSSELGPRASELARLAAAANEDVLGTVTDFVREVENDGATAQPPMYYDKEGSGGQPQFPVADEPFPGEFEPPGFVDGGSDRGIFGLIVLVAIVGFGVQLLTRATGRGGGGDGGGQGSWTGGGSGGGPRRTWPSRRSHPPFIGSPGSPGSDSSSSFGGGGGTIGGSDSSSSGSSGSSGGSSGSSFGGGGGTIGD